MGTKYNQPYTTHITIEEGGQWIPIKGESKLYKGQFENMTKMERNYQSFAIEHPSIMRTQAKAVMFSNGEIWDNYQGNGFWR